METIILTRSLIDSCRTDRFGFTGAVMKSFGLILGEQLNEKHTLPKGWVIRLRGKPISKQKFEEIKALRHAYVKNLTPEQDHLRLT